MRRAARAEIDPRAELEASVGRAIDEVELDELRRVSDATGLEARPAAAARQLLEALRALRASPDPWARSTVEHLVVNDAELELLADHGLGADRALGAETAIVEAVDNPPGDAGGFLGTGRWATTRELGLLLLVVLRRRGTDDAVTRAVDTAGKARRRQGRDKWERAVTNIEARWCEARSRALAQRAELVEIMRLVDGSAPDDLDVLVVLDRALEGVEARLVAIPLDPSGDHPSRHS
jgi:hypothetical protein